MAYLARILIYPVKSLEPVAVQSIRSLKSGALEGDRTFAMKDSGGKFINGKRNPRVHLIRSMYDPFTRLLCLGRPDAGLTTAFHVDRDYEEIQSWLSEFFALPVTLDRNEEIGFPDDLDCPGPTIVSTATLREVASWFSGMSIDQIRLRIRANLEVDGVPAFWEDRLYGVKDSRVKFRIGACTLEGNNPCQRCAVPPRDPFTGANDPQFIKIFSAQREKTLPAWAERTRFNHFYRLTTNTVIPEEQAKHLMSVGDPVEILG